jgi:hypothetical protein
MRMSASCSSRRKVALTGWPFEDTSSTVVLLSANAVIAKLLHGYRRFRARRSRNENLPLQHLLLGPFWQPHQFDARVERSSRCSTDFSERDRDCLCGQWHQQHWAGHQGLRFCQHTFCALLVADREPRVCCHPLRLYTITATLISDGDFALDFDRATVASSASGFYTAPRELPPCPRSPVQARLRPDRRAQ